MAMGVPKLGWHGVRRRANGKFQARWVDSVGMQSDMFMTKAQAKTYAEAQAKAAMDVKAGIAVLHRPIDKCIEDFLIRGTKANTRALYTLRLGQFLAACPEVKTSADLTSNVVNKYAAHLVAIGANPGGRKHKLVVVRTFCNYLIEEEWLLKNPFIKFTMPSPDYIARPLTVPEFAALCEIDNTRAGDWWLNRAFRLGYSTALRSSQIWGLRAGDFVAPDSIWVAPIKGQKRELRPLQADAVAIVQELMTGLGPTDYLFSYWASVDSFQHSVNEKVRRVGISPTIYWVNGKEKIVYPRFHDACKVSRVSDLSGEGWSTEKLAHLTNTSKQTLVAHYLQADRKETFAAFQAQVPQVGGKMAATEPGQPRANNGPEKGGFTPNTDARQALEQPTSTLENAST